MQKISEQIISTLQGNPIYTIYKLNTQRVQYLLNIRPEQTCHPKLQEKPLFKRKKMAPKKLKLMHLSFRTNRFCCIHFTHNSKSKLITFALGAMGRWMLACLTV